MAYFFYLFRCKLFEERYLLFLIGLASTAVITHELGKKPWKGNYKHGQNTKIQKPSEPLIPVPTFFVNWRNRYLDLNKPVDTLGLSRGIFLGEDSFIPEQVRHEFRVAGLSHLLAASGYNCWIVAMFFKLTARFLYCLLYAHLSSLLGLRFKSVLEWFPSLFGAWLFWAWTDQSAPITRSVIMISAKVCFQFFWIEVAFGRLLFVQYLVSLAIMPRLWWNASFQLTFGCLFGLCIFPKLVQRFAPRNGLASSIWEYFVCGTGAVLGTIPTTWLVFGEINFTSLLTNWFAIPIVSFLVMPLGVLQIFSVVIALNNPMVLSCSHALAVSGAFVCEKLYLLLNWVMTWMPSLQYYD